MRILLDENIPEKAKTDFDSGFEVLSVREMGWRGKKNGELLSLAEKNSFDVFVTLDKNLRYQQNLSGFKMKIILLKAENNKHQTIQPLISRVKTILRNLPDSHFIEVS